MNIRVAQESDVPELADLYYQTVQTHGLQYYTLEQTQAWAAFGLSERFFRQFIVDVTTFVVVNETDILGFAGIGNDGHITSVYVRHDCLHQGIGSSLMRVVLDYGKSQEMKRFYAEVSLFSVGLFKKFGFQVYDTEIVERKGVKFERDLVELKC
ncbi:MAG: GNAT family N-acetyltransferase [Roseofilum sp. SID2]|uniref:GNAT family N-acetyltransferase n=1 Tax=unclassified Roseofilum TaxID=2620099 RepID=UPI001B0CE14C|nr:MULTISPECIES: GNAT family N-acetyltransferase [unclassified Roseofilum]MBP0012576.1 GNAT family N-acetyltransferase [Roseofilum sp. SID3]MBP0026678.1 GNAT family N-acetyltransferase [Roseofilum sp. SID2]MBP0040107.1 GNAT family N-acetyltransferase [Roseofilum sp. SID1]